MGERRGLTQEQMATLKEKKAIGEASVVSSMQKEMWY